VVLLFEVGHRLARLIGIVCLFFRDDDQRSSWSFFFGLDERGSRSLFLGGVVVGLGLDRGGAGGPAFVGVYFVLCFDQVL
jgi:hypothetical protein